MKEHIIFALSSAYLALAPYLIMRCFKVRRFRLLLCDMCANYERTKLYMGYYDNTPDDVFEKGLAFNWFLKKIPSFPAMLFSFKELTLENWVKPELIKRIQEYN